MAGSEADLARAIIAWLEAHSWEVFSEVESPDGRRVVDIYARRFSGAGMETWAIEVKRALNLEVLEQAVYWQHHAHYVSVAIPPPKRRRIRAFGYKLAAMLGLGLFEVRRVATEHQKARRQPNPKIPMLHPEQNRFVAGSPGFERFGALDLTKQRLARLVAQRPGILLTEAVSLIEHHYRSARAAERGLLRLVALGKIPGVRARRAKLGVATLWPRT